MIDENPESPRLMRQFGLILAAILAVLAVLAWRKGSPSAPLYLAGALPSALLALLRPRALLLIYRPWMRAARVIATINTWVLLGLIYFLVLSPCAALRRLWGWDPLDLKLRTGESYWKRRTKPAPDSYTEQF